MEPIIETNIIHNGSTISNPLLYVAIGAIIILSAVFFVGFLIITPGMLILLSSSLIGWLFAVLGIAAVFYSTGRGVHLLLGGLKDVRSEPVSIESVVAKAGWNFKYMNYLVRLENGEAFIVSNVIAKRLRPGYHLFVRSTPFLHILLEARIVSVP